MKVHMSGIRSLGAAMLSLAVGACGASEGGSGELKLGFNASDEATALGVGLPAYPGSKPYTDDEDDSNAADIGISTPLFGLKVVAVELESPDTPGKVAAFYREAMSKYGDVIECRDGNGTEKDEPTHESNQVTCDPGEPGSHSIVYKVGTENNQRIVAIQPHKSGTQFSLVHVDIRGDD